MNTHKWPRATLALASALAALGGPMWAQQVPAAADTVVSAEDETIVLSPFEVSTSKDKGYKATNATTGTRLDAPIKDIPMNLEVITNDFMRDTGATNLRESLRYSAGVVLESQSDALVETDADPQGAGANDPRGVTRRAGDSSVKLRGFVIDQVLRDGFRRQYSADWINIDRTEVLRGPSALLYGVGSFGGVINYTPKKPKYEQKEYFGLSVGTNGFYRAEFDSTGPLGSGSWKPAYRVTGAYQERGDFTEYYKEKHWTIAPSFLFRPFKNTEVFLDNEFGYKNERGVGFQNIRANDGAPSREASWLTDSSGIVDTRTFRWSGPDTYLKGPFRNNIIDITQKITDDFFLKVGVAQSEATFDSRQVNASTRTGYLSNQDYTSYYPGHNVTLGGSLYSFRDAMFAANTLPSNVFTDGNGNTYTAAQLAALAPRSSFRGDRLYTRVENRNYSGSFVNAAPTVINDAFIQYEWKDYDKTELRNQVRAEATYKLDLGKWGKHTMLAGVQYMELESDESEFGPAYSYQNQYGGSNNVRDYARYSYKNPRDYSPIRYGRQGDGFSDAPRVHLNDFEKRTWDLGYYGVYQGQFWNDRLTFIGGARYDRSDTRQTQFWRYENTRPVDVKSRGDLGVDGQDAPHATSPQLGLSFAVTKNISVFGLYSTGIVPNPNDFDGYGNMMKPTKAKNYEAGVKFDLVDGRISGTISAYKIERENQPKYIWWAPSPYQSLKKGADPSKPAATVWWYAHPDALGQAIHHTAGMTPAQAATLARQIFPASWHPMINELAAYPSSSVPAQGAGNWGSIFSQGAVGSTFWNWAASYEANTINPPPNYTGTDYMPLVNLSDPQVVAFMEAASLWGGGWWGNQGYTAGQNYRFGSGAAGIGNTPDGSGASIPLNDEAKGWDVSLIFTPHDDIQILANFAHVERKITSRTFQFVKAPYYAFGWWMKSDDNFGTYNSTQKPSDVYLNVADSTTYNATTPYYNESGDDSPENTASLWVRCGLKLFGDGLKKWTVGFGGNWEDKRLFYSGFLGGGGNVTLAADGSRRLVKYYTDDRYTVNALVEYRTVINDKYHVRYALNIDNVLDDQGRYGLVYAPGSSYKLSVGVNF